MMKWKNSLAMLLGGVAVFGAEASEELQSRILKLDVFKNGVGVVTRSLEMPKAAEDGVYRTNEVPTSIHGTLFFDHLGDAGVAVLSEAMAVPLDWNTATFGELFGGQTVKVRLRDSDQTIEGVCRALPAPQVRNFDGNGNGNNGFGGYVPMPAPGMRILIEAQDGVHCVSAGDIVEISAPRSNEEKQELRTVLQVNSDKPLDGVEMSYLAQGIAWAPSYEINLVSKDRMTLRQSAVLRNELEAFTDAEVRLISGYPNILCRNVVSLMSPNTNLQNFLNQLAGNGNAQPMNMMTQQRMVMNAPMYDMAGGAAPSLPELPPDSVDMYFQPVGKLSMKSGESRYLELARQETTYRKLVEWTIPSQQELEQTGRRDQAALEQALNDIWESVVFNNPFDFPLTTGPVVIESDGDFNGQSEVGWVGAGREATVRITRALSIKTEVTEVENPDVSRVPERWNNTTFQRVTFKASLSMTNFRDDPVTIRVRKEFYGKLIGASDDGKNSVRPQFFRTGNLLNQLEWTLTLKPQETKKITYDYSMLL